MKIIKQSHEILHVTPNILQQIEHCGRVCYKSENKNTDDSAKGFVHRIIKSGHHSVLEHGTISVRFITNRGVTHEIVRHRLASYSQESSRYVNYNGQKMEFIEPVWWEERTVGQEETFKVALMSAEKAYKDLLGQKWKPEQAREVLPNSLKTEIIMTANPREWRHFFKLRTSKAAHPQLRALARGLLVDLQSRVPVLFDDIGGDK
jgi:thymidylate synthase (FAD)